MDEAYKKLEQAFSIKCSKYEPEQLTAELKDILFTECLNEYVAAQHINRGRIG
jgi:hypothetical protein